MKEEARFLGLNVHAETIDGAIAEPDGEVRSLGTIAHRPESIRKLVKKLDQEAARMDSLHEMKHFCSSNNVGSWYPTVGAKSKTRQGWSTQLLGAIVILSAAFAALVGCHSYHIETTVENRTGGAIQLMEVDYPSASFGADSLAAGAVYHYRIQLRGNGPLKIEYTGSDGRQMQIEGPALAEPQEGRMEIVLLPGGKAEFHPQLTPRP